MNVLVVSAQVGRSPQDITYNFVFDEVIRLVKRNLKVSVARLKFEGDISVNRLSFYDMDQSALLFLPLELKKLVYYPQGSFMRSPFSFYTELLYSRHVESLLVRLKPDLIHAHFGYPEGWVAYLAKTDSKLQSPLVVTLHGYDILTEPLTGYGIRLNRRYEILVKRVLEKAEAVLVASKAAFNEASKLVNDIGKLYLIPNGVDLVRFNPKLDGNIIRKRFALEDKQIIFTVRRHIPRYGISYLLLAAKLILSKAKDVVFIIGGDGPFLNYHKQLARRLNISSNVIFTGKIASRDLPLFYVASDIIVVPSLQETWGLVATEAMACGKPVVASNVGGLPDQIIDGYNGFLVHPRDPEALANKILYLLENPLEARKMGSNGRRLAVERFDIEKRVDKIVNLYEKLIREK